MYLSYSSGNNYICIDGLSSPVVGDEKYSFRIGVKVKGVDLVDWKEPGWISINNLEQIHPFKLQKGEVVIVEAQDTKSKQIFKYIEKDYFDLFFS